MLSFDDYTEKCLDTWMGDHQFQRSIIGIVSEGGEILEKLKKHLRGDYDEKKLKEMIGPEIGDVLYYLAICCHLSGYKLSDIAQKNIEKLASRKERGKIKGSGDDR